MTINIVAVGKLKEKYWKDAIAEYTKRLSRFAKINIIETLELADSGSVEAQKQGEGKDIIKRLKGYTVILDIKGKMLSSPELSQLIQTKMVEGISEFTFVIGGSRGLSQEVIKKGGMVISFGKTTYPHQLMRVILIEQIYRAVAIANNINYHK